MPEFVKLVNTADSDAWDKRGLWSLSWSEIGLVQLNVLSSVLQNIHKHSHDVRYCDHHTNMVVPTRKRNVMKCGVLNVRL